MNHSTELQIFGLGTDITEIERVADMIRRHGQTFKERVFTPLERGYCDGKKNFSESYAGRWCAKEAILKALGTGWSNGIQWTDIEIRLLVSGQPFVAVGGKIVEIVHENNISDILITISHCKLYATATAIIVQGGKPFDPLRLY